MEGHAKIHILFERAKNSQRLLRYYLIEMGIECGSAFETSDADAGDNDDVGCQSPYNSETDVMAHDLTECANDDLDDKGDIYSKGVEYTGLGSEGMFHNRNGFVDYPTYTRAADKVDATPFDSPDWPGDGLDAEKECEIDSFGSAISDMESESEINDEFQVLPSTKRFDANLAIIKSLEGRIDDCLFKYLQSEFEKMFKSNMKQSSYISHVIYMMSNIDCHSTAINVPISKRVESGTMFGIVIFAY